MAGLNLTIGAGTVPFGTQLPGNAQALINFVAAYGLINGTHNFNGLNFGSVTPSPENQNIPWFKTDSFGNPIGFFSWNGATWAAIPNVISNGTFANAPQNPALGTQYYATDIGCVILYSSQGWTTLSGTPGDYKFVEFATSDLALAANPGWVLASNSLNACTLAAAGVANGAYVAHAQGQQIGEEAHTILVSEMPAHTHAQTVGLGGVQADGNTGNPSGVIPDRNPTVTGSTGGGAPANVIQPTYYTWLLKKSF